MNPDIFEFIIILISIAIFMNFGKFIKFMFGIKQDEDLVSGLICWLFTGNVLSLVGTILILGFIAFTFLNMLVRFFG